MPLNYADNEVSLSLNKSKVLIVDDQLLSLVVLKKILMQYFIVSTVNSGEEAIERCKTDTPDIILLDISMGGMSGVATCQQLKATMNTQHIPVIFVTSLESEESDCWEAGAVDFIKKPINPETVFRRVRAHLTIKLQHDLLSQKVFLDELTQVYNRRYFEAHVNKVAKSAMRDDTQYALLFIDIDYFKQYNDTYGHMQGDNVLSAIAQTIISNIKRPADFVARYGGEEFVVVLPQTAREGALCVAEKIQQHIAQLAIAHQHSEFKVVSVSIGGATSQPNESEKSLLQRADKKMYQAKIHGRNQACF
ncbi:diguanylate cyclase [Pseudoalteromonas sp.]|uniref:GGDEF domain-containing response regulator n=1 Tax=Pseudoalteromonas sp. TaxID=53249 RepID=UPI0035690106